MSNVRICMIYLLEHRHGYSMAVVRKVVATTMSAVEISYTNPRSYSFGQNTDLLTDAPRPRRFRLQRVKTSVLLSLFRSRRRENIIQKCEIPVVAVKQSPYLRVKLKVKRTGAQRPFRGFSPRTVQWPRQPIHKLLAPDWVQQAWSGKDPRSDSMNG